MNQKMLKQESKEDLRGDEVVQLLINKNESIVTKKNNLMSGRDMDSKIESQEQIGR